MTGASTSRTQLVEDLIGRDPFARCKLFLRLRKGGMKPRAIIGWHIGKWVSLKFEEKQPRAGLYKPWPPTLDLLTCCET